MIYNDPMIPARLMIAQSKEALPLTMSALQGFELVEVTELKSAQSRVLEDDINLFVIGIHFDESRALELVQFIRSESQYTATPIIMVRLMPTAMADFLRTTVNALIRLGSINQYLELEGDPDYASKVRAAVNACIPADRVPA